MLDTLEKIEAGGKCQDWGPGSWEYTVRIYVSGWTPSDRFIDTEDYCLELTFPTLRFSGGCGTMTCDSNPPKIRGEEA